MHGKAREIVTGGKSWGSQESITFTTKGNVNKQGGHQSRFPMSFLVSPKDSPLARFRFVKEMRW